MNHLLRAQGIVKRYNDFTLDGVSIEVAPGEVVGFVGANGSGKTTTMKAILGLIHLEAGSVELFDEQTYDGTPGGVSAPGPLKERIGVVFDTLAFPHGIKTREVPAFGKISFSGWDGAYYQQLCQAMNLKLDPDKRVNELSRGNSMKLQLAFAMAHRPDLLILDEPTAGLDPFVRDEVLELLCNFVTEGERGVLLSSHITSDLEKIADRVVCINDGREVFNLPREVITDEAGVARVGEGELAALAQDPGADDYRYLRKPYDVEVLVPDRFVFAELHPNIRIDACTIDQYMNLLTKGESL